MDTTKKFLQSASGLELKKYLLEKLNELRDIDNINDKDTPTHQAIELKAQKRAYFKLQEIMEYFMIFSQKEKVKDERDDYNVQ